MILLTIDKHLDTRNKYSFQCTLLKDLNLRKHMLRKIWNSVSFKVIALAICTIPSSGFSCTDFLLKAEDRTCIVGRSLEFAQILPTRVQLFPKGEQFQSPAPNNQKGMQWTSKYAFVGMVILPSKAISDGFNEKGFSVGALWMPGTEYPAVSSAPADTMIHFADIMAWLLGNVETVEEAKNALEKMHVYSDKVAGFSIIPPVHLSLHDANGKSGVVEFIKGKVNIYDNPVDVLTNAPEYPWHLTNLSNYINLSPVNAGELKIGNAVITATGQGTGFLGVPGDWTPPSRFVRTALFKNAMGAPKTGKAGINAAFHLLNTVDIPYGTVREKESNSGDFTQWIVVKDLTNKKLYVRTYGDLNIREFDFLNGDQNSQEAKKGIDLQTQAL
ncbi:Uncharacterized protein YxeI [Parachlamydia acanthamoebae]|nr:Uncharacterized protein YxeI [Parachlamydia acanthamoebae]